MKYLALSYERSDHDAIDSIDTKSTIAIDKHSELKYEERWAGRPLHAQPAAPVLVSLITWP
jgi:hypothetical protein